MATKKKMDFEGSMARLEEIVCLLERGDAPLEQAMTLFEEGAKLLRECTKQLDQAEQKVTLLTAGEDGQPVEEPFQGES
ncbi:exodeoxyribonuclease VII small subunit [Pseudoflavonifractor phocaeensis]|uniref:exodeoxyribonuclease VII small subunit n=1 Tax=Pseudoflavonifractor phocaeensis TaxID=1870988 RepID=UPI001F385451|nr:exodeoxyribonuclease VII small subunit [Pseudoflavonifractor phocaeensis]MCF2596499.1 exodeoxyribonuclease VII small subunit [Pseudoflavonifractor phocaeensis]